MAEAPEHSSFGHRVARLIALGAIAGAALLALPSGASADGPSTCDGGVRVDAHNQPIPDPDAVATKYTCRFPFSVPGFGVKQTFNVVNHPGTDFNDATVTHMEVDVVNEDGSQVPINRLMLHHIVFANLQRPDPTCAGQGFTGFDSRGGFAGGGSYQRFYAAGEERAKMTLPDGYGYAGGSTGLPWGMVYMVMNHKKDTDNAFIQYSYTVQDAPQESVTPYWLDEVNCHADPIYNVPGNGGAGSSDVRTVDYTMPVDGRIIAGAGHVHGGARKLTLTQPDCNDRRVAESIPTWGYPDHPFYNVRPILHEPGPINMTAFGTETGIPAKAGTRLRLNSVYDNSVPHVRVMGIMVVYIDEGAGIDPVVTDCDPVPNDVYNTNRPDGRDGPVPFTIPLTGIDSNGNAVTINAPPGAIEPMVSGSTIDVTNRTYSQNNISIKQGGSLTWKFIDGGNNEVELHNITLANGPVGIGSPNLNGGRTFSQKFTQPGTYKFFCGLHPVQMTERVIVKAKQSAKKHKKNKKKKGKKHRKR